MSEKSDFEKVEGTTQRESTDRNGSFAKHGFHEEEVKHGDRALAMIGDERVVVTDEDVRLAVFSR